MIAVSGVRSDFDFRVGCPPRPLPCPQLHTRPDQDELARAEPPRERHVRAQGGGEGASNPFPPYIVILYEPYLSLEASRRIL